MARCGRSPLRFSAINPLLRRLEERRFITGEWQHPTKRSRREYAITPQGHERVARIKSDTLPYLDLLSASIDRLRDQLYTHRNAPHSTTSIAS